MKNKQLKIGDKVRFLNSIGGGIIKSFQDKNIVLVEDESGFDIPVLLAECVLIEEGDKTLKKKIPVVSEKEVAPEKNEILQQSVHVFEETLQGERLNIHLAFLPVDQKSFTRSSFEAFLINESNYYLYYNYMSCRNNSWTSRCHGLIEPDMKIFMEEFDKAVLNELEHFCVQLIVFKEGKPFSFKQPLSVEMRFDTVKFYKRHCFTPNSFFDEDALVIPLVVNDISEKQMLISSSDIKEAMYGREEEYCSSQPAIKKQKHESQVKEVDLHIHQLLDSTSGMNNSDILNYQMSKFHEVMKENTAKRGSRIVFIHGKGEGVLRTALEKELKTTYKKQCYFQDASFREYGYGATMVTMRQGG